MYMWTPCLLRSLELFLQAWVIAKLFAEPVPEKDSSRSDGVGKR